MRSSNGNCPRVGGGLILNEYIPYIPLQRYLSLNFDFWWGLMVEDCRLRTEEQALTGTRYPTLPGFNFYYPYPTRKSFENFRVQGSNYTCCFHKGLYQWCQLFSSGGKGFSFIIPLYTGFSASDNLSETQFMNKHNYKFNLSSCNYDCNVEVFTLFCRTPSEIFHSIIWEFLSQFTNFLLITLLEKF